MSQQANTTQRARGRQRGWRDKLPSPPASAHSEPPCHRARRSCPPRRAATSEQAQPVEQPRGAGLSLSIGRGSRLGLLIGRGRADPPCRSGPSRFPRRSAATRAGPALCSFFEVSRPPSSRSSCWSVCRWTFRTPSWPSARWRAGFTYSFPAVLGQPVGGYASKARLGWLPRQDFLARRGHVP
jgi:hypothetical protein